MIGVMGRKRKIDRDMPQRVYWQNGRWRHKSLSGKWTKLSDNPNKDASKPEAIRKYADLIGTPVPACTLMSALFDRFETELLPDRRENTARCNRCSLVQLRPAFDHMAIAAVRPVHLRQYMDARGKKSKTRANRELSLLSVLFKLAMGWGYCDSNPCQGIKKFKETSRTIYVTDEMLQAFFDIDPPLVLYSFAWIAYRTGIRKGDLLLMPLENLIDEGIKFKASKTGKWHVAPWTPELKLHTGRLQIASNPKAQHLIVNRKGEPYTDSGFNSHWKNWMKKIPEHLQFAPGDLRAKWATDLDAAGGDPGKSMAHSNKRVTDIYLRLPRPVMVEVL